MKTLTITIPDDATPLCPLGTENNNLLAILYWSVFQRAINRTVTTCSKSDLCFYSDVAAGHAVTIVKRVKDNLQKEAAVLFYTVFDRGVDIGGSEVARRAAFNAVEKVYGV